MMTTTTTFPHYIFGYGSLICPSSRAVTAPTLQHRVATPVRVRGLQRIWSFPVPTCAMTFMGIRKKARHNNNATCVGVLVPVNDEELIQFDAREWGYDRVPLPADWIEKFPTNTSNDEASEAAGASYFDHCLQAAASSSSSSKNNNTQPQVWVYLQQDPSPVNVHCPLAQTYLDVIMRGCLTISHDFLAEFLQTTRGWSAHDFYDDDDEDDDPFSEKEAKTSSSPDKKHPSTYWVNDRHDPLYVRADVEYSLAKGDELDQWLEQHRPVEIQHRRPLYGKNHTM